MTTYKVKGEKQQRKENKMTIAIAVAVLAFFVITSIIDRRYYHEN